MTRFPSVSHTRPAKEPHRDDIRLPANGIPGEPGAVPLESRTRSNKRHLLLGSAQVNDALDAHFAKPGVELLEDVPGVGALVERKACYEFRLRMWLSRGDHVRWINPQGSHDRARLEDDGTTLFTTLRVDRQHMFAGLLYGVEGMRVGGTRRLRVAPHLAYREAGVPGMVPPNAVLVVEVHVVAISQESTDVDLGSRSIPLA